MDSQVDEQAYFRPLWTVEKLNFFSLICSKDDIRIGPQSKEVSSWEEYVTLRAYRLVNAKFPIQANII
jgi:hypothetical protein